MPEEKKEPWLNYLALTTVILAVSATLSTFKGGGYSTKSVLNEIKVSNQWNFYQAKKIRGYLLEIQKDALETDLKLKGSTAPPQAAEALQKRIDGYAAKLKKWDADRASIEKEARQYEKTREQSLRHAQAFGFAVIFLQMAILLSSIAALMRKKIIWVVGLVVGAVGMVYFADGFLLFM